MKKPDLLITVVNSLGALFFFLWANNSVGFFIAGWTAAFAVNDWLLMWRAR
jgi:hypothetical protein